MQALVQVGRVVALSLVISSLALAAPPEVDNVPGIPALQTVIAQSNIHSDYLLSPIVAPALAELHEQAASGNAIAQAQLADKYYTGEWVEQNRDLAVKWYQLAADQGLAYPAYLLSILYSHDDLGVGQNLALANHWRVRADNAQDAVVGQRQLAARLFIRQTALYDAADGLMWYEMAADNGDVVAQIVLGDLYMEGSIVPQSDMEALKWYSLAANQGDPLGQYHLGVLLFKLDEGQQNYQVAFNSIQQAATNNLTIAQYRLGELYYRGLGVEQSDINAYAWWQVSNAGHVNPEIQQYTNDLALQMSPADLETALALASQLSASFS